VKRLEKDKMTEIEQIDMGEVTRRYSEEEAD